MLNVDQFWESGHVAHDGLFIALFILLIVSAWIIDQEFDNHFARIKKGQFKLFQTKSNAEKKAQKVSQ